jgi:LPXTG-motif cell wall-anchored protein
LAICDIVVTLRDVVSDIGHGTYPVSKERPVRKMTVLGATALLIAGLVGSPAAAFAAPIAGAPVSTTTGEYESTASTMGDLESTCPKDGKVDVEGAHVSLLVTAEPGFLITGYCVKAGSDNQGDGPENYVVNPPAAEVTITHSSGKEISHYTLITIQTEPTPSPSVPSGSPSPEPSSSEPAVEPSGSTEPTDGSTVPGEELDDEVSEDEPEVLASTGASTVIGFTLIALALVGGGVTLIVLRRKGVLGS